MIAHGHVPVRKLCLGVSVTMDGWRHNFLTFKSLVVENFTIFAEINHTTVQSMDKNVTSTFINTDRGVRNLDSVFGLTIIHFDLPLASYF